ncbi:MAG: hypothetical protein R6V06_10380 [Kiritimatiellia bacterium]
MPECKKVCLVFIYAVMAVFSSIADVNTEYRAKSYSSKSADNKNFHAKSYRPEKKSLQAEKYAGSSAKSASFWNVFKSRKKIHIESLPEQRFESGENFENDGQTVTDSESPRTRTFSGQDEFKETEAPAGKPYKPSDKKRGRNPLLAPRHGIKAPLVKDEK